MPDFKVLGDDTNPVVSDVGSLLQGIGYPLRTVEGNPPFANPVYGVPAELVLFSSSFSTQQPVAVDTPLQVNFGGAISAPEVDLAADGTMTFTADGVGFWLFVFFLNIKRAAGGTPAKTFLRNTINGIQGGAATNVDMGSNVNVSMPFNFTFAATVADGDIWRTEMYNEVSNDPSLHSDLSTLWGNTASATLIAYKFKDIIL